jgi:hypothetical protein
MLKIILVPRRHPALTREAFFDHLANKHAPLVKGVPEFTRHLRGYVQNHTVLPAEGAAGAAAFRHAIERDSVIELWFDDRDALERALGEPRYLEVIRPDEARFNDLPSLIVLPVDEHAMGDAAAARGDVKLFDVMKRRPDIDRETFVARWKAHLELLSSRVGYRELVRGAVLNVSVADSRNPFGHPAAYDGVMEVWVDNFADATSVARLSDADDELKASEQRFVDRSASFSVVARERPIIGPSVRPNR